MINDMITWKCLCKMSAKELQDAVGTIIDGEVTYNQSGWEDVYPTDDEILDFAKDNSRYES